MTAPRHVLVVANETVAGKSLIEALERRAAEGPIRVTVICPVTQPAEGYVVYEDTRRASSRRRLDKTLELLRSHGIAADGFVVDADPVSAVRDSFAQLEPRPDEIVVSTHPEERSGWLLPGSLLRGYRRRAHHDHGAEAQLAALPCRTGGHAAPGHGAARVP